MKRSHEPELLDDLDMGPEDLSASLNFMTQVNRSLGGTRVVTDFLQASAVPDEFSVLDIGCGAGDIPQAVVEWAKKKGKKVSVTAIDLNPLCIAYARHHFPGPEINFLRHSAFDIERLGAFDFVISSMFFHHLSDGAIVKLLSLMNRQARRGILVNDLYRNAWNYLGAYVLGVFSFNSVVFNDAKLSVKRAFVEADLWRYCEQSGLPDLRIERKPIFRLALSRHA